MDPCPFVHLTLSNLALKIPVALKPACSIVHPSSSPCFCKIKLRNFPLQTAVMPFIPPDDQFPDGHVHNVTATFHLSESDQQPHLCQNHRLATIKTHLATHSSKPPISNHQNHQSATTTAWIHHHHHLHAVHKPRFKKKKDCKLGERGEGENGEKERKERAVREDLICKTFYMIFKWLAYKSSLRDSISR